MSIINITRNTTTPKDKSPFLFKKNKEVLSYSSFYKDKDKETNKFKDYMSYINNKLDNYLNFFNKIYSTDVSLICKDLIELYRDNYMRKIKIFDFFEDQIKELNIMIDGVDSDSNFTINLMINNLLIDKNKEEINLNLEMENSFYLILQKHIDSNIINSNEQLIGRLFLDIQSVLDKKNDFLYILFKLK